MVFDKKGHAIYIYQHLLVSTKRQMNLDQIISVIKVDNKTWEKVSELFILPS